MSFVTGSSPHRVRKKVSQDQIHGLPSAVVRVRPKVRVGVQSLGRVGVSETRLDRLDRLPMTDQQAPVIMP